MPVKSYETVTCHYVEASDVPNYGERWTEFRRNSKENWEVLMGSSWESVNWQPSIDYLEKGFMHLVIGKAVYEAAELTPIDSLSWFPKNKS